MDRDGIFLLNIILYFLTFETCDYIIYSKLKRKGGGKQTKQTSKAKKSQDQTFSKPLILFISELSLDLRTN